MTCTQGQDRNARRPPPVEPGAGLCARETDRSRRFGTGQCLLHRSRAGRAERWDRIWVPAGRSWRGVRAAYALWLRHRRRRPISTPKCRQAWRRASGRGALQAVRRCKQVPLPVPQDRQPTGPVRGHCAAGPGRAWDVKAWSLGGNLQTTYWIHDAMHPAKASRSRTRGSTEPRRPNWLRQPLIGNAGRGKGKLAAPRLSGQPR